MLGDTGFFRGTLPLPQGRSLNLGHLMRSFFLGDPYISAYRVAGRECRSVAANPKKFMGLLDGIFNSAAGIGQALIDARTARRNTDATNQANREMAEYAYSKDLEMWERANAYNSPESQMSRLKAAGLNPNMVYGSGSAAGNTASTLPRYSAPRMEYNYKSPVDLGSVIGMFQDVQMKDAQIDLVRQQAKTAREMNEFGYGMYRATGERERASQAGWRSKVLSSQAIYSDQMAAEQNRQSVLRSEAMAADVMFKRFRNQWMAAGVTSSDHPILRMVVRGFFNSRGDGSFEEMMNRKFK